MLDDTTLGDLFPTSHVLILKRAYAMSGHKMKCKPAGHAVFDSPRGMSY